jgi:hypothetical protein
MGKVTLKPVWSFLISYGEGGIRTHGKLPYTAFPVLRLRPLGHFSTVARILTLN